MAAYEVLLLNTAIPQIQAAQSGDTYVVPRDIAINATAIISANSATDALRITQTGAGNAILVEDSANPDSTPFVVTAAGDVGIGTSSPDASYKATISGNSGAVSPGILYVDQAASPKNYALNINGSKNFVLRNATDGLNIWEATASGNLGLGVTPSTGGYGIAYQFAHAGNGGAITAQAISANNYPVNLTANAISSGASTWKYFNTDASSASRYEQRAGVHSWHTAASGTAGNPITFTQAMTLDASGNLVVGNTTSLTNGGFTTLNVSNNSNGGVLELSNGSTRYAQFVGFSGAVQINAYNNAPLLFQTGTSTTVTERARITSSGGFEITGVASTRNMLQVGSANSTLSGWILGNNSAGSGGIWSTSVTPSGTNYTLLADGGTTTVNANTQILFGIANAEKARITSGGDLLIGSQTDVAQRVRIEYDNVSPQWGMKMHSTATSGDNNFIEFGTEAVFQPRGSITYNRTAGLTSYNTTSDYRAKDIIGPVANSGATIDALKVYEGKMKGATQSRPMLVAHEAQEVAPYAVTGEKDAVNEDGTPKYQQMDVSSLVPLLLAEIQSLRARVKALEGA